MSMRMTVIRAYLRWHYRFRHDLARMQRDLSSRQFPAPVPAGIDELCEIDVVEVLGRPVRTLTPRTGSTRVHLVHLHGGAYVYSAQEAHWRALARLAVVSGATIHAPLYALAPDASVDDAHALLDAVIDRTKAVAAVSPLFLSGDSAGGGLALSQALRMRDAGRPPVDGVLLFSPWLDVTLTNPGIAGLERKDPMLSRKMLVQTGRWWARDRDTIDPLVSPLRGDLGRLPPVTTYIGGRDILLADARELDLRIRAVGGESTLREWPSGFHVFMAALKTKEARAVIADAARLLRAADDSDQSASAGIG